MKINRNNYEIFFIDYWDGNLDPVMEKELMTFLHNNYDLKEEFEGFENNPLVPDQKIIFDAKEGLKKSAVVSIHSINENNYEEYFIAYHEADLSSEKALQLEEFIMKNPSLEKEFQLFSLAKLEADTQIVFAEKKRLKKAVILQFEPRHIYYSIPTAASLLLLFGLFFMMNQKNPSAEKSYADHKALNPVRKVNVQKEKSEITGRNIIDYTGSRLEKNVSKSPLLQNIESVSSDEIANTDIRFFGKYSQNFTPKEMDDPITDIIPDNNLLANNNKKEYPTVKQFLLKKLRKNSSNKMPDNPDKLNFWDLADLGLSGFNRIANKDIKLNRETNAIGNTTAINITASNFEFGRKVKK